MHSGLKTTLAQSELCRWRMRIFLIAAGVCLALCATAQTKKQPPAKPLDLNTATIEQLQQLPGIGPVTAKSIVRFRSRSGPFRRVEDLLAVRGIGKRRLERVRPYVTVSPRAPTKKR